MMDIRLDPCVKAVLTLTVVRSNEGYLKSPVVYGTTCFKAESSYAFQVPS